MFPLPLRLAYSSTTCRKALAVLKKKKYQETLLARTEGQIDNLEHIVSTIADVVKCSQGLTHQ